LASLQQLGRPLNLDVRCEHDDRHVRKLFADRRGRLKPLVRVRWRHPNIHDRKVRLLLANVLDQLRRIPALTHNVEAGPLEQACKSLSQKDIIVSQHDAGGTRAHPEDYGPP
jgi:hypothetical protein